MARSFVFLLIVSLAGIAGLLILFNASPTGMAEYGILWKISVPEEAEERLGHSYFPVIEGRRILTHEQLGVTSREAWMRRQLTPKKAPLQSPSHRTDSYCVKSNGLQGRVFELDEAELGYGQNCERYTDLTGRTSDYLLCCDPFTGINPLPFWLHEK